MSTHTSIHLLIRNLLVTGLHVLAIATLILFSERVIIQAPEVIRMEVQSIVRSAPISAASSAEQSPTPPVELKTASVSPSEPVKITDSYDLLRSQVQTAEPSPPQPEPAPVPTPALLPTAEPAPTPVPAPMPIAIKQPLTEITPAPIPTPVVPKPTPEIKPEPAAQPATNTQPKKSTPVAAATKSIKPETKPSNSLNTSSVNSQESASASMGSNQHSDTNEPVTGARFDAEYLHNPPPVYPAYSKRMKEQGTVFLLVQVSAQGTPTKVQLHKSSGYERLDEAALASVSQWSFVPAKRGNTPIAASVIVPIHFKR